MDIVKKMWAAYCEAAGGVTYDGKPLPTWEELGDDRHKCWIAAGKEATDEIERLRGALQKIADVDDEKLPTPVTQAEGVLWSTLGACVDLARKALGEKE